MTRFVTYQFTSIACLLTSILWSGLSMAAQPTTFRAVYDGKYNGLPIRTKGIRELKRVADDRYLLTSSAKSFLASISEQSLFVWTGDSRLIPLEYQYHRKGLGRNRHTILNFDWANQRVRNNVESKPWFLDIPTDALDRLSYQLKMRQDLITRYRSATEPTDVSAFRYQIVDGGKLKDYRFEIQGDEWIESPIGYMDTIKVLRIREHSRRSTTFWLAKEWQFLLVRLQQTESKGGGFELLLREAEIGGQTVQGLPEPAAPEQAVPDHD